MLNINSLSVLKRTIILFVIFIFILFLSGLGEIFELIGLVIILSPFFMPLFSKKDKLLNFKKAFFSTGIAMLFVSIVGIFFSHNVDAISRGYGAILAVIYIVIGLILYSIEKYKK